jgi:hypothetical protein
MNIALRPLDAPVFPSFYRLTQARESPRMLARFSEDSSWFAVKLRQD